MNQYGVDLFGSSFDGKICYTLLQSGQTEPCSFCTNHLLVKDGVAQEAITYEQQNTRNGKWYQCTDRAIEWTDGKLARLQIAVDITEIKQMETVKDEMISAVSHEMRTPLTAMLGFSEFLLDNQVDADKQHEIIETIYHETERLNELIGSFLDMQRMKNDPISLFEENLPVKEILDQAAKLYAINKKRCRIVVACPDDLPNVKGDSKKLHQVMINLLSNACKYSSEGSLVTIGAEYNSGEVIFFVEDEGLGIAEELRDKVFEKFYRIDNSDRRKEGGTGIGLALVKEIITAHGGRVWIEANSPVGSRVLFALHAA